MSAASGHAGAGPPRNKKLKTKTRTDSDGNVYEEVEIELEDRGRADALLAKVEAWAKPSADAQVLSDELAKRNEALATLAAQARAILEKGEGE